MKEHLKIACLTTILLTSLGGVLVMSFGAVHEYKNMSKNVSRISVTLDRIERFLAINFPAIYED